MDHECPSCGSHNLDDGSFDFEGPNGRQTHRDPVPHYSCMDCGWDGTEVNECGDHIAMLEDKADGEHEERMLRRYFDEDA